MYYLATGDGDCSGRREASYHWHRYKVDQEPKSESTISIIVLAVMIVGSPKKATREDDQAREESKKNSVVRAVLKSLWRCFVTVFQIKLVRIMSTMLVENMARKTLITLLTIFVALSFTWAWTPVISAMIAVGPIVMSFVLRRVFNAGNTNYQKNLCVIEEFASSLFINFTITFAFKAI